MALTPKEREVLELLARNLSNKEIGLAMQVGEETIKWHMKNLFAKLDAGMTEVTRPSLYGAQHPITVVAGGRATARVVFVGPCCESGDVLTPAPGDPEALAPREVPRPEIGDLVVVGGAGAYCAAMCTGNYNSYPLAPEVLREPDGSLRLVRRRQTLEQMLANEVE
jgi:diaminopimelate decarboxylase